MGVHLALFIGLLLCPSWMHDQTPDERHFYRRLFTARHRARKRCVKYIWLSAASIWMLSPSLPLMIFITLLSTFLSFSLLDESR